jgi:hypothetical protein
MERFDEVVNDIKGAWVATHKTVKEVEYTYEDYFYKTNLSTMMVIWKEKNPERLAKQIHDLIFEMEKLGHTAVLSGVDAPWGENDSYNVFVRVTYTERFDD